MGNDYWSSSDSVCHRPGRKQGANEPYVCPLLTELGRSRQLSRLPD